MPKDGNISDVYEYAKQKDIQGIEYTRLQTEYQRFPEEFFTGADLTVYFEHIWLDDLTRLSFSLSEQVQPIYGYNSYTWDAVARGNRIVQGYFAIPFKEAGYIFTVLNLIGQAKEKAAPALGYLLGGEDVPKWIADVKQNMEDMLFDQYAEHNMWKTEIVQKTRYVDKKVADGVTYETTTAWKPYPKWGDRSENVKALHKLYVARKIKGIVYYPEFPQVVTWAKQKPFVFGSGYRQYGKYDQHDEVKKIQERLNVLQPVIAPTKKKLAIDGYYGPLTTAMMKAFQVHTQVLKADGNCGYDTALQLSYGFSDDVTGYFGTATKFVTKRFQQLRGLKVTGVVDEATQEALGVGKKKAITKYKTIKVAETYTETVKKRKTEQELREEIAEGDTPQPAEELYTDYERGIWARPFDPTHALDYMPHFYRTKEQEYLLLEGFDIYINYGPLPEAIEQNQGLIPDTVNFNTTVKAIRNIQITGTEQVLDASGQPIEEIYHFIAKDLD